MKAFVLRLLMAVAAVVVCGLPVGAQILSDGTPLNPDSIRRDFKDQPYFGLYKDNYFIFGPSIDPRPNRSNTNIKFQISFQQRITNATLPGGFYAYIFYSQKCFWNILEDSMPMTDLNFNPGVGISKPLFVKNRYIGKATIMLEHESNGRDSIWSRSWNKVSFGASVLIDPMLSVSAKAWIPIVDGEHNRDILRYCGIFQSTVQVSSPNRKLFSSLTMVKRKGWNLKYNYIFDLAFRLTNRSNQFLFLQYYDGYGEGLLEYNVYKRQVRVGLLIKPKLFSDY